MHKLCIFRDILLDIVNLVPITCELIPIWIVQFDLVFRYRVLFNKVGFGVLVELFQEKILCREVTTGLQSDAIIGMHHN